MSLLEAALRHDAVTIPGKRVTPQLVPPDMQDSHLNNGLGTTKQGHVHNLLTASTSIGFCEIKNGQTQSSYLLILVLEKTPQINSERQTSLSMRVLSHLRNIVLAAMGLDDLERLSSLKEIQDKFEITLPNKIESQLDFAGPHNLLTSNLHARLLQPDSSRQLILDSISQKYYMCIQKKDVIWHQSKLWKSLHVSDRLALQTIANSNDCRDLLIELPIYFTHTSIGESEMGITQFCLLLFTVQGWQVCVVADQGLERSEAQRAAKEAAAVLEDNQNINGSLQAPNCVAWMYQSEELVYSDVRDCYQIQFVQAASNQKDSSFICFERKVVTKMDGLTCMFEFQEQEDIFVQGCWLSTKSLLDSIQSKI